MVFADVELFGNPNKYVMRPDPQTDTGATTCRRQHCWEIVSFHPPSLSLSLPHTHTFTHRSNSDKSLFCPLAWVCLSLAAVVCLNTHLACQIYICRRELFVHRSYFFLFCANPHTVCAHWECTARLSNSLPSLPACWIQATTILFCPRGAMICIQKSVKLYKHVCTGKSLGYICYQTPLPKTKEGRHGIISFFHFTWLNVRWSIKAENNFYKISMITERISLYRTMKRQILASY